MRVYACLHARVYAGVCSGVCIGGGAQGLFCAAKTNHKARLLNSPRSLGSH